MQNLITLIFSLAMLAACSGSAQKTASADTDTADTADVYTVSADSAMAYLKAQTALGPRIHGTDAHTRCAALLASTLERHGAQVTLQKARLQAADGEWLDAVNIFGQYNPESTDRLLLVAHWDSRPWADNDPDEANHSKPVLGANDGASGVAVLLEIARQLSMKAPEKGVDILLVDAEDRGNHEDDDSWALGSQYFVANPVKPGYRPTEVILLDMVGGTGARFAREYFSMQVAPELMNKVWAAAADAGYSHIFTDSAGGAINDDHVHFIAAGIPAIDIIEYSPDSGTGFNPFWHTADDTDAHIDPATLQAAGSAVLTYIHRR